MEKVAFALTREWIALNDLLKVTGLVSSGGLAKAMIGDGLVQVDSQVETRKTCKIRAGQVVTFEGALIVVTAPEAAPVDSPAEGGAAAVSTTPAPSAAFGTPD